VKAFLIGRVGPDLWVVQRPNPVYPPAAEGGKNPVMEALSDKEFQAELDGCIRELQRLKADTTAPPGVLKQ
jgi:hypothetical protein